MKEQKIPLEQQLVYNVEEVATLLKTTRPVVYFNRKGLSSEHCSWQTESDEEGTTYIS